MANRRRGAFSLPEEFKTDEKISTKKELAQRKTLPSCPGIPKVRRSIVFPPGGCFKNPRPVYFKNSVALSPSYDPEMETSYFEQMFSSYHVIGEGSFGKVYRVVKRKDNEVFAVKRLKSTTSFVDRYAEVRNNEKVGSHPNIVQFHMAWEEYFEVFMLLEYCTMSLSDFCTFNNDIPEELLWSILYDICKGLNHLHSRSYVHLDVKPGNIMMKGGYFKLADFGILVDLKKAPLVVKTLSDGDSKYLALEVLEGIYKPSCDIFGLGLTLLELAADLELPNHGPLWQQLRHEILPKNFYDRVSLGFTVIIERMLKPEHDKRPSAEKILKYSTIKDVEKRDKKCPRYDYAKSYAYLYESEELAVELPFLLNNNNNNMSTPPCAPDVSHVDVPEYYREVVTRDHSIRLLGRKTLFQDDDDDDNDDSDKKVSPKSRKHTMTSRESENAYSSSSSVDDSDSLLAEHLSDSSFSGEAMDVDKKNNGSLDVNSPMSDDELVTSTPVLRLKSNLKLSKIKLSFDE